MFHQARLKLTAWYLLIITVISLSFSVLIYQLINAEISRFANSQKRRFENNVIYKIDPNLPPPAFIIDNDLIADSRQRLLFNLIIINGIILIVSGSLSYFLAGRTLSPIQKMTEGQKQFVSDASHELKTPLAALKTTLEVSLRDKRLNLIEAKKVLKDAIYSTNQLKVLSDSLLKLNNLNNNGSSLSLTLTNIENLMINSVKKIKPQADKKKIKIQLSVSKNKIKVDEQKIEELFLIILDNAIKYSPTGSTIKFIALATKKNTTFQIIDQGIGISQKDLPHIFDRFYRADNARTKNGASGYGLGLSIAKKITENHHGSLDLSSKLKKGTTFTIVLPNFS